MLRCTTDAGRPSVAAAVGNGSAQIVKADLQEEDDRPMPAAHAEDGFRGLEQHTDGRSRNEERQQCQAESTDKRRWGRLAGCGGWPGELLRGQVGRPYVLPEPGGIAVVPAGATRQVDNLQGVVSDTGGLRTMRAGDNEQQVHQRDDSQCPQI